MASDRARDIAFIMRCAGAAMVSLVLAQAIGLSHPVWASMTGIIVSQDRFSDTGQATLGRCIGTLIGVAIAVLVGSAGP